MRNLTSFVCLDLLPDFWKALPLEELWESSSSLGLGIVAHVAHLEINYLRRLVLTSKELSERKKQMTYFFL